MEIKDSGERRQFETGAVRDVSEGKGRCDLLPLDVVGDILGINLLYLLERFKTSKRKYLIRAAIVEFANDYSNSDIYTTILEVSKQYEGGAKKYGENNWKKGIPAHCYLDSGVRHLLKYLRGDKDEPHDRAFVWNMFGLLWTLEHKPELDDIEKDLTVADSDTKNL